MADTAARLENAHGLLRETGERAARAEVRCELLTQQLQEVRVALARVTAERDELRDQSRLSGRAWWRRRAVQDATTSG